MSCEQKRRKEMLNFECSIFNEGMRALAVSDGGERNGHCLIVILE